VILIVLSCTEHRTLAIVWPGQYHSLRLDVLLTFKELCRGRWRFGPVQGFTTTGIGTATVPVRFNCPPEAALIELRKGLPAVGQGQIINSLAITHC